jgi:serine/threonine protein kinase
VTSRSRCCPPLSQESRRLARFRREAQLLASLNHPSIGSIYGFEEAGSTPALVLELVEGQTLASRLARGPLRVEEALRLGAQIAEALEAAHERGIVHRDLKPGNVMLRPGGTVKVLDFGLATALGADHVDASGTTVSLTPFAIAGTPAYMAPEQARGEPVDRRADIWAFGCVLYEMLTGRSIFGAATATESLAKVREAPIDVGALPDDTPASVRRLVRRCLNRSLGQRPQHIGDARADLIDARIANMPSFESRQKSTAHAWTLGLASRRGIAVVLSTALLIVTAIARDEHEPAAPCSHA